MQFEIKFDFDINPFIYRHYSLFLFNRVKKSILKLSDRRKYRVRESIVSNCTLIKWKSGPKRIDLYHYINNCLELVKLNGVYVIRVNTTERIPGSFTKVITLVRILEYGTNLIPPYPVIRRVFNYYRKYYMNFFVDFIKESFSR